MQGYKNEREKFIHFIKKKKKKRANTKKTEHSIFRIDLETKTSAVIHLGRKREERNDGKEKKDPDFSTPILQKGGFFFFC